jgi:hypothetical protein
VKYLLFVVAIAACAHAPAPAPAPIPPPAPPTEAAAPTTTREAYARATTLLYQRDFDGALRVFQARVDAEHARGDLVKEAWLHNVMTWVRWAAGDHAGALAENEQVARVIADPSVSADDRHGTMLHYWWDRAYLLAEDPATRAQADDARKAYVAIADPKAEHDGLAVLAAFFAVVDGDGAAALAAAQEVDAAEDDDLQDLYVLALARDAGGDHAGADALRAMIRKGNEYPMKPMILLRLQGR